MTDDGGPDPSHLDGFDPYDAMAAEARRVVAHAEGLDAGGWAAQSRCSEWTVGDVVAHLAGTEVYNHACLDGRVQEVIEAGLAAGMTSVDDFNQAGVDERTDRPPAEVTAEYAAAAAETIGRLRERDGGTVDSSVGEYPARWQAFHVAAEWATHADDIGAPVAAADAAERMAWRVAFSRFALTERRPGATVEAVPEGTRIVAGDDETVVDDGTLVAGLADRLDGPDAGSFAG